MVGVVAVVVFEMVLIAVIDVAAMMVEVTPPWWLNCRLSLHKEVITVVFVTYIVVFM
jgi:hypothetical protein